MNKHCKSPNRKYHMQMFCILVTRGKKLGSLNKEVSFDSPVKSSIVILDLDLITVTHSHLSFFFDLFFLRSVSGHSVHSGCWQRFVHFIHSYSSRKENVCVPIKEENLELSLHNPGCECVLTLKLVTTTKEMGWSVWSNLDPLLSLEICKGVAL